MKRLPSGTCWAVSQLPGSCCRYNVALSAAQFRHKMGHFATGCTPKQTSASHIPGSIQCAEHWTVAEQTRTDARWATERCGLTFSSRCRDAARSKDGARESGGRRENPSGVLFISSFNEEVLSSKTAVIAASRLWPPRLTILPQLPILCQVLKSSSACWLLLLHGAILSHVGKQFIWRKDFFPSMICQSYWSRRINNFERQKFLQDKQKRTETVEGLISKVYFAPITLHSNWLHWKFRRPGGYEITFYLAGVAKCLMLTYSTQLLWRKAHHMGFNSWM